ncbi:MAG TPA: potassium transporter TrkG [Tepidisphaeraceae bacterium]|jgi:Trk-type K+ transport system membrane component
MSPPVGVATLAAPVAPPGWSRARFLALGLFTAWVVLTAGSCFAFRSGHVVANGNETTWDRAIFTAINTSTLTGFQQTMGLREMRVAGMIGPTLLLVLTLGGSFLSLTVGGLAASRILRMPHTASQIAWAAGTALLLSTLGGGAMLAASGRNVFEAIFQSTSAFGNSGLWLGPLPGTTDGSSYLVLLPLVILGGLGLPVLMEISDRLFGGPPLSRHSRVVLMLAGGIYLAGFVALVLAQAPVAWGGGAVAWRNTIASCSVAAINTRSAGLPFQSPAAFTVAGQWLLMALMLIGAAPAGTGSGLKTTTLWQLARGVRDVLRGRPVPRPFGIAAVWLVAFTVVLFAGILLLATIEPQIAPDRLLFLCCSAIGNVGLSHDPVSTTGPGLLVLSCLMLAGRMGALAILWWMAETTSGADVLVG